MSVVYHIHMFLFAAWQFNKAALWKCDVSLAEKATLDRLVLCWSSLVDHHPKYAGDQKCWSMQQGNVLYYSKFCKIMRCKIDVSGISLNFLFVTLNSVCCAEYICDNLMESSHLWCAKTSLLSCQNQWPAQREKVQGQVNLNLPCNGQSITDIVFEKEKEDMAVVRCTKASLILISFKMHFFFQAMVFKASMHP